MREPPTGETHRRAARGVGRGARRRRRRAAGARCGRASGACTKTMSTPKRMFQIVRIAASRLNATENTLSSERIDVVITSPPVTNATRRLSWLMPAHVQQRYFALSARAGGAAGWVLGRDADARRHARTYYARHRACVFGGCR